MNSSDRTNFIVGFVKGYIKSSIQRFDLQDGQAILKRVPYINNDKIKRLAEVKAIHCLLYDGEYKGENFTLGEVLDALNKNSEQAAQITKALNNTGLWKR